MPRIYARIPVIDRVMAKVVADGDCWIWTGSVGSSGYGKIGSGGRYGVDVLTHRTVWEHHNGPIPEGLVLDHLCGVIRCCNPWHLEPVIQTENQRRQSARRTACNAGHTYTPESARVGPNGRECRICHAARERARRAALRAEGLTARVSTCGHRRTQRPSACVSPAATACRNRPVIGSAAGTPGTTGQESHHRGRL
jgi:hypothetical protein